MAKSPIVLKSREVDDDELRQMLHAAVTRGDIHDIFFEQFEYNLGDNPFLTLTRGEALLGKCKEVAPDEYAKIHKGTPFYWLARAAFQVHDYETAAFYIDAAVSDDLRAADDRGVDRATISTPAILFFLVYDTNPNQASIDLVKHLSARIQNAISQYLLRPRAASLNLANIRDHFFRPAIIRGSEHLRTQVTAFLTFMLEWEHRSRLIQLRTDQGTAEPFFLHLFKGCVLFESLLRAKTIRAGNKLEYQVPLIRTRGPSRAVRWT